MSFKENWSVWEDHQEHQTVHKRSCQIHLQYYVRKKKIMSMCDVYILKKVLLNVIKILNVSHDKFQCDPIHLMFLPWTAVKDIVQKAITIAMEIRPASKITIRKEMFEYEWYLQTNQKLVLHGTNLSRWEGLVPQKNLLTLEVNLM